MTKTNDPHIIEIFEEVTVWLALRIGKQIAEYVSLGSPPLTLLINSNGGCAVSGLSIFHSLSTYPGDTVGKVVGAAESMAAVVLQACKQRRCDGKGHLLIHHLRPPYSVLSNFRSDEEEATYFAEMSRHNDAILKLLSKRTKQPISVISELCDAEKRLTPKRALKLNLIDSID